MYSALVYIALATSMALYSALLLIPYLFVLMLPPRKRGHFMRCITLGLGKVALHFGFGPFVRINYIDTCPEHDETGIYVCNHRSATDAFLMAVFGKEAVQVVNGWPMKLPFFGFNAKMSEYIDSTRVSLEEYKDTVRDLTSRNVSVIAFPEEHRSGSNNIGCFHSCIFRFAMELQLPVYPVCIAGNENFPDKAFRFHRTTEIQIRRLAPIMPEQYKDFPSAYVFKKRVQKMIVDVCDEMDRQIIN